MFPNVFFNFATAISKFDTFSSNHIVHTRIAKVTNFLPFCTIGISMYQKRILPYFIIPYLFTPCWFPFGAFQTDRQTDGRTAFFTPCYLSSFFFHWARGALPAGATLLGWPNYGVDGRLNKSANRKWLDSWAPPHVAIPTLFPPVQELAPDVRCDEPLCNNNANNARDAAQHIHNKY